jgi:hypothetical protein
MATGKRSSSLPPEGTVTKLWNTGQTKVAVSESPQITPPTGVPCTPPRVSSLRPSYDTPFSKGSGSHSGYHENHTRDDYAHFLEEDLSHKVVVGFDSFLEHFLNIPITSPAWLSENLSTINKILEQDILYLQLVQEYARKISVEMDRYQPFVKLANHAISQIRGNKSESNIVFCRNDPAYIQGSAADRKPDTVIVNIDTALAGLRGGVDNMSKEGPKEQPFHWDELLSFFEHKQDKGELVIDLTTGLVSEIKEQPTDGKLA